MKLLQTLKIALTLVLARTFGRYLYSGWNGDFDYAKYEWRGKVWCFPISPVERQFEEREARHQQVNTSA